MTFARNHTSALTSSSTSFCNSAWCSFSSCNTPPRHIAFRSTSLPRHNWQGRYCTATTITTTDGFSNSELLVIAYEYIRDLLSTVQWLHHLSYLDSRGNNFIIIILIFMYFENVWCSLPPTSATAQLSIDLVYSLVPGSCNYYFIDHIHLLCVKLSGSVSQRIPPNRPNCWYISIRAFFNTQYCSFAFRPFQNYLQISQ